MFFFFIKIEITKRVVNKQDISILDSLFNTGFGNVFNLDIIFDLFILFYLALTSKI